MHAYTCLTCCVQNNICMHTHTHALHKNTNAHVNIRSLFQHAASNTSAPTLGQTQTQKLYTHVAIIHTRAYYILHSAYEHTACNIGANSCKCKHTKIHMHTHVRTHNTSMLRAALERPHAQLSEIPQAPAQCANAHGTHLQQRAGGKHHAFVHFILALLHSSSYLLLLPIALQVDRDKTLSPAAVLCMRTFDGTQQFPCVVTWFGDMSDR